MICKGACPFSGGIFKYDRVDQSLDIKSLRRRSVGAKTVETKALATGAFFALAIGIYKL